MVFVSKIREKPAKLSRILCEFHACVLKTSISRIKADELFSNILRIITKIQLKRRSIQTEVTEATEHLGSFRQRSEVFGK